MRHAKRVAVFFGMLRVTFFGREEYNDLSLQRGVANGIISRHAISDLPTFPCTHYVIYGKY
jgi:hypothetical protein